MNPYRYSPCVYDGSNGAFIARIFDIEESNENETIA